MNAAESCTFVAALLLVAAGCSASASPAPTEETGGWVTTQTADVVARSRMDDSGIRSELRNADGALLAVMTVPAAGTPTWSSAGGGSHPIVVAKSKPRPTFEDLGTNTVVTELPRTEREANDLLYRLDTFPAADPAAAGGTSTPQSLGCQAHYYDNMTCVVCADSEWYCYACSWGTSSYGQCTPF